MVNASALQTTISNLIDSLGSTLSIRSLSSTVVNKWGTRTKTYGSASSITAVPDNLLTFQRQPLPQGVVNNASMVLICKGTESVNVSDLVVYNSRNYTVISVQPFPLDNTNLAIQFALEENNDDIA